MIMCVMIIMSIVVRMCITGSADEDIVFALTCYDGFGWQGWRCLCVEADDGSHAHALNKPCFSSSTSACTGTALTSLAKAVPMENISASWV